MLDFIKKNIFITIIFTITLSLGFLTFLTFIDKSFIKLNDQNLQFLLIASIGLLILLFIMIFYEVKNSLKIDVDVSGSKANIKYIENKCIKQEYQRLFLKVNPVFPALKN